VAAEPEPVEYVRVCDAFGTGYFYIPGTETCLRISGEVRVAVNYTEGAGWQSEWNTAVRARVALEAKNDSELGTIGSYIRFEAQEFNSGLTGTGVILDQAFITVGNDVEFKIGYALTYWDDFSIVGEGDNRLVNDTKFDMMSVTYNAGAFTVGVGVDHLTILSTSAAYAALGYNEEYNAGLEAMMSATFDPVTLELYGVYDIDASEGAIGGVLSAEVGPGTFEMLAGWASGASQYTNYTSAANYTEWTVGAGYELAATDALTITPSVNWSRTNLNVDTIVGSLFAAYDLADGLEVSGNVRYVKTDGIDGTWVGFGRLTRSF
jgi:hypothetical protein